VVRQDRHQPVAGWRASRRGAMPASRDAIRPGTSQWRGCSTTARSQVEAGAGVAAGSVPAAWSAAEQEVEEVAWWGNGWHGQGPFCVGGAPDDALPQAIRVFLVSQVLAPSDGSWEHDSPTEGGRAVALKRLCKAANSIGQGDCPAMYLDIEDLAWMVGQGPQLDAAATGELLERAPEEVGVRIPTETVLRAVGLFLADRGHPGALAEVQAYLAEVDC
jgi:hypothetical protein